MAFEAIGFPFEGLKRHDRRGVFLFQSLHVRDGQRGLLPTKFLHCRIASYACKTQAGRSGGISGCSAEIVRYRVRPAYLHPLGASVKAETSDASGSERPSVNSLARFIQRTANGRLPVSGPKYLTYIVVSSPRTVGERDKRSSFSRVKTSRNRSQAGPLIRSIARGSSRSSLISCSVSGRIRVSSDSIILCSTTFPRGCAATVDQCSTSRKSSFTSSDVSLKSLKTRALISASASTSCRRRVSTSFRLPVR